jgi:hypothetical protein
MSRTYHIPKSWKLPSFAEQVSLDNRIEHSSRFVATAEADRRATAQV